MVLPRHLHIYSMWLDMKVVSRQNCIHHFMWAWNFTDYYFFVDWVTRASSNKAQWRLNWSYKWEHAHKMAQTQGQKRHDGNGMCMRIQTVLLNVVIFWQQQVPFLKLWITKNSQLHTFEHVVGVTRKPPSLQEGRASCYIFAASLWYQFYRKSRSTLSLLGCPLLTRRPCRDPLVACESVFYKKTQNTQRNVSTKEDVRRTKGKNRNGL